MRPDGRVLVVDDSFVVRAVLRSALEDAGYWVEEAEDAETAQELIEQDGYDVVVVDLRMPGRSGFTLFAPAQRAGSSIIVVTASLPPDLHARAVQHGADVCLVKHDRVAAEVVAAARRILEAPAGVGAAARDGGPRRDLSRFQWGRDNAPLPS
jgi:CheY-like chemotaxis protein